jgi:hypothetical protein
VVDVVDPDGDDDLLPPQPATDTASAVAAASPAATL